MKFKNDNQRKAVMASMKGRNAIYPSNIIATCQTQTKPTRLTKRDTIYKEDGKCKVRLWNTDIATIDPKNSSVTLNTGGYTTNTTKDRLNRVLNGTRYRIYQQSGRWYVSKPDGGVIPFSDGMTISHPIYKRYSW